MRARAQRVVVVGGSAGGLEPLTHLVSELPDDLPAAVLAVLHFPPTARTRLALILDRAGPLPCVVAGDGEPLEGGRVYVAPPDHHLLVGRGRARLSRAPRENGARPAIDPLFRSAARSYGEDAVGVVLCGLLDDGSAGLLSIRRAGGTTVVLDPDTCSFPDMPRNAVALAEPDHVVPMADMAQLLSDLSRRPAAEAVELSGMGLGERTSSGEETNFMARQLETWGDDHAGRPSGFSCPECHGVLWEVDQPGGSTPRFECRIGHRVSTESLFELRLDEVEGALWASVRALEEQGSLAQRLCDRAAVREDSHVADHFRRRAEDATRQAAVIRTLALQPRTEGDATVDVVAR